MNKNLYRLCESLGILLIYFLAAHSLASNVATPITKGEHINFGDITMYVEQHGKGEPIIFLHGGMGAASSWEHQVEFFSKNYRVITPDSRGQARSGDSSAALTYHLMAEDTIRLMDKLKIPSAYIVGWSDGGNIGIDIAIHHPERVKKLVAYGANINPAGLQKHFLEYLQTVTPEKFQRDNGRDYLDLSPTPEQLPVIANKIKMMWLNEPNFTAAQLAKITAPTLVMDGEQEELIRPDHAKEIAAAIPHAKLVMLPGVGHYAMFQATDVWNKTVMDFLKAR